MKVLFPLIVPCTTPSTIHCTSSQASKWIGENSFLRQLNIGSDGTPISKPAATSGLKSLQTQSLHFGITKRILHLLHLVLLQLPLKKQRVKSRIS